MLRGPFRGSDAIALGLITTGMLRGPRYRRLWPDVYVAAGVELTLTVRAYAAFLLVERSGGVMAGYSAAEWLGRSCGPAQAPAEVLVPGRFRPYPRLWVHRGEAGVGETLPASPSATVALLKRSGGAVPLPPGSVPDGGARAGSNGSAGPEKGGRSRRAVADGGVPVVTTPLRTAWDLTRRLDLVESVVAVDALARRHNRYRPGFDPAELIRLRSERPGARGCRSLDRVVALADPRAESPMETRLRLLLVLAGLPGPHVQYRLDDVRVRFDLAYPEVKLAIEYDGEDHDDALDRARDVVTSARGWHTIRLVRRDVVATPARTLAAIRDILAHRVGGSSTSNGTTVL